ncbi:lipoyl(octanoyl) transferase LipB [Gordonia aichiensis]|uniref:Octanoyltransferase n=1 Tax=Gordonia aichiensis NBRC 108223 TaxID=1220583 RepID=L7KNW1_9ACTN|nr:lipoyl(octanoyl) transferase LipB [Gordonia aichiensis]GAC49637.1 octanoyltransferase [Gordonia aichiensis NBRC 108223]
MPRESIRSDPNTPIEVRNLGVVDYRDAYEAQHALAAERADGTLDHDLLLLLEHPSTYTAGKRTEQSDLPTNGATVVDVDRGGRITWHGPGQLVGYPIVALAQPLDVVDYVRRIESALITVCARFSVTAGRVEGRSGVWVCDDAGERKLGQIGIRVARGVTLHGFALNVHPDMSAFDAIVPCGIADAGVTSLALEAGREITVDDVLVDVVDAVRSAFDHRDVDGVVTGITDSQTSPEPGVASVR